MTTDTDDAVTAKLRIGRLLPLFAAGFLGILNETVPAGLLPAMSDDLGHSEAAVGQTITVYALATAFTAIPLNAALRHVGRRTLLLGALLAFVVGNGAVAMTNNFATILVARAVAGVAAGLIWSNIGGYAARLVPGRLQGKAIAVTMAGIPAALALGLPAGTALGDLAGWQATFWVMAAAAVAVMAWIRVALPAMHGAGDGAHVPMRAVVRARGIRPILLVILSYMVAHNMLYTYVGPLAARAGAGALGMVLLVFGAAAVISIGVTGWLVDPHHRRLVLLSTSLVTAAALALCVDQHGPILFYVAVAAWGLGFGGSATLLLTAGIRAAGTDSVQSLVVTTFNLSIALGSLVGGLVLAGPGVRAVPWVASLSLVVALATTVTGRRHSFPAWSRGT